jgi:hypothetical protein
MTAAEQGLDNVDELSRGGGKFKEKCVGPNFFCIKRGFGHEGIGKHDDFYVLEGGVGAYELENISPAELRHNQVEDHEVRFGVMQCLHGREAIFGDQDFKAFSQQAPAVNFDDIGVIFNDENRFHYHILPLTSGPCNWQKMEADKAVR